jgi:peptide chain release factor subunit 1
MQATNDFEILKMKKQIDELSKCAGTGTNMVTLLISHGTQLSRVSRFITDELGSAKCIKSKVNRKAVIDALTSIQHRVKDFTRIPANGIAIFYGTMNATQGKRELLILEPVQPIKHFLYKCDNKFHVEELQAMFDVHDKYGFIIIDGEGTLFASVCGSTIEILHKYTTTLPKKHGMGGQSAPRFQRLRF